MGNAQLFLLSKEATSLLSHYQTEASQELLTQLYKITKFSYGTVKMKSLDTSNTKVYCIFKEHKPSMVSK